jgi:hypothetical protein
MAYTEFRKSYGDFEIVIPAIDFSELSGFDATTIADVVLTLQCYKYVQETFNWSYVCNHLTIYGEQGWTAAKCICQTIDREYEGLEHFIADSMGDAIEEADILFAPYSQIGRVLRIEWCKHMAKEIEREFGL